MDEGRTGERAGVIARLRARWRATPPWKRWRWAFQFTVTCVNVPGCIAIISYMATSDTDHPWPPREAHETLFTLLFCGIAIIFVVWVNYAHARARAGHRWRDILNWWSHDELPPNPDPYKPPTTGDLTRVFRRDRDDRKR